jgi:broad specificity phosphatase PhoE
MMNPTDDTQRCVVSGQVLLIRHGRTAGNGQCYVGRANLPLDVVGEEQARRLAALVVHEPLDAIYCSPLLRAQATARPLAARRGLPVAIRPALIELDYGSFSQMTKADHQFYIRRDHRYVPLPGGESLYDIYRRVCGLLDDLGPDLAAGRHVALVGHFWTNRILVGALARQPFEEIVARTDYKPANGSVFRVRYRAHPDRGIEVVSEDFILPEPIEASAR